MSRADHAYGSIITALRNGDLVTVAALLHHLAETDPHRAETVRDAIEEANTQRRARRGAIQLADHTAADETEYRAEMDRNYWEGAPDDAA